MSWPQVRILPGAPAFDPQNCREAAGGGEVAGAGAVDSGVEAQRLKALSRRRTEPPSEGPLSSIIRTRLHRPSILGSEQNSTTDSENRVWFRWVEVGLVEVQTRSWLDHLGDGPKWREARGLVERL